MPSAKGGALSGSFPALKARPPALLEHGLVRIKEEKLAAYEQGASRRAVGAVSR